jgi:hypothetical protein
MADRGLTTGMPIWLRVPGIVALILVVVVAGTLLVGATSIGRSGMDRGPMEHNMGPNQDAPR